MDGFVNVLKAPGMTSSNVVYDVRKLFDQKRAGHLGTLDPGAAGVLPVALGRGAKLFDLLVDKEKAYRFEIRFGVSTDTGDLYGRPLERKAADVRKSDLDAILPELTGERVQRVPAYSALKVDGRKMYDLARAGEEVPERLRRVQIFSLRCLEQLSQNRFLLDLRCSRGTYVRTVAEEIGQLLGLPACVSFLLRTASGSFALEDAVPISELAARKEAGTLTETLISPEAALAFLPELTLPKRRQAAVKNALPSAVPGQKDGKRRLYCDGFLGVGDVNDESVRLTIHLY